jgi:Spy/CpxP family protein refolding chaperone
MSNHQWAVGGGVALLGAIMLVAQAADMPHLNVKLGLWEVHTVPQMSGDYSGMAEDQLANLTPEQRARMQAAVQAAMAGMNKPRLTQECMTAERIQRGFGERDSANCKTTVMTNSGSEFESRQICTDTQGTSDSLVHVSAKGPDHVIGTVKTALSRGGRSMNLNATMEGKWLSSDCGDVKDSKTIKTQ